MTERDFRDRAALMARIHIDHLLNHAFDMPQDVVLSHAVDLIHDCLDYLDQPHEALAFALAFHPIVEQWALWSGWANALDMLLTKSAYIAPPQEHIRLLNCRSQAARECGDMQAAGSCAMMALQQAEALQEEELIASSLNKLGIVAFLQDQLDHAQAHLERAYAIGHLLLPAVELGHITMNLGTIAVRQGRFKDAEYSFSEALRQYQAHGDPFHVAKVQCNSADLENRVGQIRTIPATLLAARTTFKALGAQYEYGLAENDIGCIALKLQRLQDAEQAFDTALQVFEAIGSLTAKARVLSNIVALLIARAEWSRAERIAQEARELAATCEKPLLVATIDVDLAKLYAAQGDTDRARHIWMAARAVQLTYGAHQAAQKTQRLMDTLPPG